MAQVTTEGGGVSKGFSIYQRGAALVLPMPKLFVTGFGATIVGYGMIAGLERWNKYRRERSGEGELADAGAGEGAKVNVVGSGLAIGTFLAVSTNLRYQVRRFFAVLSCAFFFHLFRRLPAFNTVGF